MLSIESKLKVVFDEFPWPPQSNNMYVTARTGYRFPSKELKEFKEKCAEWKFNRYDHCKMASELFMEQVRDPMRFIHVEAYLICPPQKIWTQENKKQRWDTTNRIKAIHDAVSTTLGIDDCHFQVGPHEKIAMPDAQIERFCIVQLTVRKIKTFAELCQEQGWIS